ncbi:RNA polymerase sigma factor [Cesiribacter andamanensis]|uniref:RNA polymerase sigma factor n=1 Tax=Cesiribacter andamanensis AMV16 TaxID=1279009 RepID=M7N1F5_9BACT|nr:sigma-70 family RNA polymerase sigma factor [Cesiribacter andamanensis]EMR02513.1 RNA polymerase sigma factor [Cesiribacter andamanensis AMV16]
MKDSEVLERISRGDEKALDFLYKKYYRMMTRLVVTHGGSDQEAKDVFQDALIVFWQKAASGNLVLTSKISTYLYSVCQNLWRKELERKSKLVHEAKDGEVGMGDDSKERIQIIRACVAALGPTCRNVLSYYYFDGMSMDLIAEKMGFANTDTAKTKKYKCKKKLDELVRSKYSKSDFMD